MDKRYFFASSVLHIILLIYLSLIGGAQGQGISSGFPKQGQIVPKVVEVEVRESLDPGNDVKMPEPKKSLTGLHECKDDNWYGGVGIYQSILDGTTIAEVIQGYPASRAGIRKGDVVVLVNGAPESGTDHIRGDPGTEVTITVNRSGERLTFTMVRDRICTDTP